MKIKILIIISLFVTINVSAQTFSGGTGSYADPYLISSKADMVALADAVGDGNTYADKFFRLTQNLTGSNAVSTSIGDYNTKKSFQGVFDGGGYEIESNKAPAGIFGYIYKATIQNLGVSGVVSTSTYSNENLYIGGICGNSYNSMIAYCYNTATVFANTSNDSAAAGGICGEATNKTVIINSFNMGVISSEAYNSSEAGGISGYINDGSHILNCYNTGNVSSVNHTNFLSCAGGICGYGINNWPGGVSNYGTDKRLLINDCFSVNVSIEAHSADKYSGTVARIVGYIFGNNYDLSNNYASSTMSINGSIVSKSDKTSENGADNSITNFKSQSWIQSNLGWDFDAVWQMSSSNSSFEGFPVFRNSTKPLQYTIAAKAGNNGSIMTDGESKVNQGESKSYTFTPNPGFLIYQVLIDGINNSTAVSSGSYTFTDIAKNHTIEVIFRPASLPTFSGGQGTKSSPYLISSKADMLAFADAVEGGVTYADNFFRLTQNLTGSNAVSTSIGLYSGVYEKNCFMGVFDGSGFKIELKNVVGGVFGNLYNATVLNLEVSGMVTTSASQTNYAYAGGISAYADHSKIYNCQNSATVSTKDMDGIGIMIGGICGNAHNSEIKCCNNTGNISNTIILSSSFAGGGIVGSSYYTQISNCFNLGEVSCSGSSYELYVGGICGQVVNNSEIMCSYNIGNISAISQGGRSVNAGGICGAGYKLLIKNCFSANASIKAKYLGGNQNSDAIGRIVGWDQNNVELNNNYVLSSMNVNGSTIKDSDVTSKNGAGTSLVNFKSESWIQGNLGWNFGTVWQMSSNSSAFQGFPVPIFKIYTITASADINGWIFPSSCELVAYGSSQTFTFVPNAGYEIDNVLIDGVSNTSAITSGSYTFTDVTSDHMISVTFKQKSVPVYTIKASAGNGGKISPDGNVSVNQGSSQTFTFAPDAGYEIDNVLIDGTSNTAAITSRQWIFQNITKDHSISVSFKRLEQQCLSNIVVQVWDDVLSINNNPTNNGGYTFTSYQWLKNGIVMPGETSGNLYLINDADKNISQYTCSVTTSEGQVLQTCPLLSSMLRSEIRVYPNPTQGMVIIESPTLEKGDRIDVYTLTGNLAKQYQVDSGQTKIDLSSLQRGIYIVKVNGKQVKVILL